MIFIDWIEESPAHRSRIEPLFHAVDRGELEIVTSAITLLEVLIVPYRAGKIALAERYEQLLTRSAHLRLVDVDRQQVRAVPGSRGNDG